MGWTAISDGADYEDNKQPVIEIGVAVNERITACGKTGTIAAIPVTQTFLALTGAWWGSVQAAIEALLATSATVPNVSNPTGFVKSDWTAWSGISEVFSEAGVAGWVTDRYFENTPALVRNARLVIEQLTHYQTQCLGGFGGGVRYLENASGDTSQQDAYDNREVNDLYPFSQTLYTPGGTYGDAVGISMRHFASATFSCRVSDDDTPIEVEPYTVTPGAGVNVDGTVSDWKYIQGAWVEYCNDLDFLINDDTFDTADWPSGSGEQEKLVEFTGAIPSTFEINLKHSALPSTQPFDTLDSTDSPDVIPDEGIAAMQFFDGTFIYLLVDVTSALTYG